MGASSRKHKRVSEEVEATLYLNWKPLCDVNFVDWVHGECLRWSFDQKVDYTSKPDERLHPWSTCGRLMVATVFSGSIWQEQFDSELDAEFFHRFCHQGSGKKLLIFEMQPQGCRSVGYPVILPQWYSLDNLKNKLSSQPFFRKVNVIGLRDEHVVVQIVRKTGASDFLLIHKEGKSGFVVKSIFSDFTASPSFLMEAYISPDNSKLMLKPSIYYSVKVGRVPNEGSAHLLEAEECQMCVMKTLFTFSMLNVFAFDPRFHWRRLAVGKCRQLKDTSVAIYDISTETVICNSDRTTHQMSQNLVFSPDGRYLASLVVSPCTERGVLLLENVIVYDSDDLTVIRRINCPGSKPLTALIPTGIFPLFSTDARYMAVVCRSATWDSKLKVVLFVVPCDISLQNLCRRCLLDLLPSPNLLSKLPLPKKIQDFLMFKPYL